MRTRSRTSIREASANERVIESITCPEHVEVDERDRFDCRIAITDGSEEAMTVEQLDDDGSVRVIGTRQTRLPRGGRGVTIKAVNAERGNRDRRLLQRAPALHAAWSVQGTARQVLRREVCEPRGRVLRHGVVHQRAKVQRAREALVA
jgi:Domain of unknown function (DUF4333)